MKELDQGYEFTKDQIAELKQLRQRVASQDTLIAEQNRLNKERQEWALHTNEVIRELRQRVVELESASFNNDIIQLELCEKLAASQLENKRLRSALECIQHGTYEAYQEAKGVARSALCEPTDTEALEKYVMERLGEPVSREFQSKDGTWHGFIDEKHYQNTLVDSSYPWPIRDLYALKEKP